MGVFNLPEDVFPGKRKLDPIIFHNYSAPAGSFKGRSILNRNAISLVISGEKTMLFAEKTVKIKDDEFHFLSSGNCVISMDLSRKKAFKSILVFFEDKILSDFFLKYGSRISKLGKRKIESQSYIAIKKDAFVLNFIDSLKLLLESGSEISLEMKTVKFEELMLHLLEKFPDQLLAFQTAKPQASEDLKIRKTVETNITNQVTLNELAFLCDMSLSTFKRRFDKLYGMPPNKWLVQRRMEIAKGLLRHYHEKPSEVYYKVGYENHSSFSKSFRDSFGVTPKQFQLQQLNVSR